MHSGVVRYSASTHSVVDKILILMCNTADGIRFVTEHMHDVSVFVTNSSVTDTENVSVSRHACGIYKDKLGKGDSIDIHCDDNPTVGTVLYVWIEEPDGYTVLCEVEIYGSRM